MFGRKDDELDEEIRTHLHIEASLREERGEPPAEARRSAEREFGNVLLVKEATRESWGRQWIERLIEDVRYGVRLLLRSKAFTATILFVLALGIGSVTAVFSLLDAVLLRTLPVHKPEQLVWFKDPSFSWPIYREVRAQSRDLLQGLFAWTMDPMNVEWSDAAQSSLVMAASGEYHSVMRASAAAGRLLNTADEEGVAVISYRAWQQRFGRDPRVIGSTVRIQRVPFTIVGVEQRGYFGPAPGLAPEITIPVTALRAIKSSEADFENPHKAWLHLMARLKDDVTIERADAALQVFWLRIMEDLTDKKMPADRRAKFLSRKTELMAGDNGYSRIRRRFSTPLLLLLGCVSLLLLATCASAANLLLARNSVRRREFAVRVALGASRSRVLRQSFTEGLLIALAAGALGVFVASQASVYVVSMLQTAEEPVWLDLTLDWRILGFAFSVALATTLLFAVLPAFRTGNVDPGPALKETSRAIRRSSGRWLVAAQVALAVLLVCGAALFTRSLARTLYSDPGFDKRNLLVVRIDPLGAGYSGARLQKLYTQAAERLRAIPGVESASFSWVPPISNEMGGWWGTISTGGAARETRVYFNVISPGYFDTVRQRLLSGRDFGATEPVKAVIVNEALARTFFGTDNPLGRMVSVGRDPERQNLTIVGIVRTSKYQQLHEEPRPTAYLPISQSESFLESSNLLAEVRAPLSAASAIRQELTKLDANLMPVIETLDGRIAESLVVERSIAVLTAFLGGVALLLACTGLYGLAAFTLAQRTGEIGVRLALGASQGRIAGLMLADGVRIAIPGVAAGLAAAAWLSRYAETLLHGITTLDPTAFLAAAVLMLLVTIPAAAGPARRASRIDPVAALRHE